MARSYATIFCAIWDDPEFLALGVNAQRTYFMLVTQPDISACGTLPLTLRRWSRHCCEADRGHLEPGLKDLMSARFIFIDDDTEELLVRTFVKHDGGYKHAQRVKAVTGYAEATRSHRLRSELAIEFHKLGIPTTLKVPLDRDLIGTQVPLDRDSVPTEQAIESRRVVVTEVGTTHNPQPEPETALPIPAHKAQRRAARIERSWMPSATEIEWARENGITDDVSRYETSKFIDYWIAKSGANATKTDWAATWRNWMRTATERYGKAPGNGGATAKVQGWLDLAGKPQAIEGAK